MEFPWCLIRAIILFAFGICCVAVENPARGLPFNIPGTKFCSPCEKSVSKFYYPTAKQDEFCLRYTNNIQSPNSKVIYQLLQLLQAMRSIKSQFSYVVHAYIESMRAYQAIFQVPYDISVFAMPTLHDSSCIKLFKSGVGFLRKDSKIHQQTNRHYNTIEYSNGQQWESIFLNGMEDIWSVSFCNIKNHERYYLGAVNRVHENSQNSPFWTHRPVGPYDTLNPIVNQAFFRDCGDNSSLPKSLADDAAKCKGKMECQLTPGLEDHQYARVPPQQQPVVSKKKDTAAVSAGTSDAGNKKPKIEIPSFVINEFNPFKPSPYTLEEFVELRIHPPPKEKKQLFKTLKLIAIGVNSLKLLLVINLNNIEIPASGYFAVRSTTSAMKSFVHVSTDDHQFNLLPGYAKEPIALLLLRGGGTVTSIEWERIMLKPQRSAKAGARKANFARDLSSKTEATVWSVIRQTVIDAQLYGMVRNQPLPTEILSVLPTSYTGCNFIIPVGDVAYSIEMEASFNLCHPTQSVEPYHYQFFKLGSFTIGSENDCSRDIKYQVERSEHVVDMEVDTVGVTSDVSSADQCPMTNNLIALLHSQIQAEVDHIKRKYNPKYTTDLYPPDEFKTTTWLQIVHQNVLNLDAIPRLQPFELVRDDDFDPDAEGPTSRAKHFRCKLCWQRNVDCPGTLTHSQKRSRIDEKEPIPTSFADLRKKFFNHLDSQQHLTTVLFFIQRERMQYSADNGEHFMTTATPEMRELANVMDITFTFLHTNTAPFNAKAWYNTLTKIGASVGSSLHSKATAYNVVDFIATEGTSNLISYLLYSDPPFTLILDGSADNRNHHYVIVYLQALEGEVTIPYFLFLLKLGRTFDAGAYRDALIAEVKARGTDFVSFFKRRIVSVATDSASVMHSFQFLLSKWVGRTDPSGRTVDLLGVYCLAHKLQLTSRNAIIPLKSDKDVPSDSPLFYFSYLEKFMQSSYVWFKWSGKRIGLFRELIAEEDFPKVEFKELHTERWISSEYRTVKNFATAWKTARSAIQRMLSENPKENKFRAEIMSYDVQFQDKTALITIHFIWDFTAAFKVWSEYLQKMAGLLMDQFKYFEQLNNNIAEMEKFNSPILLSFLDSCTCHGKKGCTLDEYETLDIIEWNGMTFKDTKEDAPTFRNAATELLIKVKEQLVKYIPWELLSAIYKLHPSQFPASKEVLDIQYPFQEYPGGGHFRVYAEDEITKLSDMLGIFNNDMIADWQRLVHSIVSSPQWKTARQSSDSNLFWALLLRDVKIDWTVNTKLLVRTLKTIAPGSVACETGFSVFNNIKTKARMGISDSHVESIMKILINGPKSVNEFDSYYYATHWLLRGHTKPKPTSSLPQDVCEVPEKPFVILDDVEIDDTSDTKLFPFEIESLGYQDVYLQMSMQAEFKENTKEKRTQSRIRSKIM